MTTKELNDIYYHNDVIEVSTRSEAYSAVEAHFGTLKCKSNDEETEKGELWCVYPPQGVYDNCLYILIKK